MAEKIIYDIDIPLGDQIKEVEKLTNEIVEQTDAIKKRTDATKRLEKEVKDLDKGLKTGIVTQKEVSQKTAENSVKIKQNKIAVIGQKDELANN